MLKLPYIMIKSNGIHDMKSTINQVFKYSRAIVYIIYDTYDYLGIINKLHISVEISCEKV